AKVVGNPHDFARRLHFWAEHSVDTRELVPGKDWGLYEEIVAGIEVRSALDVFRQELAEFTAGHEPRRDFRHGHARGLRNIRHGARRAGVDFENVDLGIARIGAFDPHRGARDGELDVH